MTKLESLVRKLIAFSEPTLRKEASRTSKTYPEDVTASEWDCLSALNVIEEIENLINPIPEKIDTRYKQLDLEKDMDILKHQNHEIR